MEANNCKQEVPNRPKNPLSGTFIFYWISYDLYAGLCPIDQYVRTLYVFSNSTSHSYF